METRIESSISQPLPTWFVILVYIASTGIGALFGSAYKAPGILTAGVGGLIAGIIWAKVMNRLFVAMKIKWGWFLLAGVGLGILTGVADAIPLNLIGVTLHRMGYINNIGGELEMIFDDYLACLLGGSIYGVFGGFFNGLLWSIIATVMYDKKISNHAASMDSVPRARENL